MGQAFLWFASHPRSISTSAAVAVRLNTFESGNFRRLNSQIIDDSLWSVFRRNLFESLEVIKSPTFFLES
jgi:hypothetical protein